MKLVRHLMLVATAAAGLIIAGTAQADGQPTTALARGSTMAVLATPLTRPSDPVIDGRIWHCDAAVCQAAFRSSARSQPLDRECAGAARVIGAFASYQTGAEALEGEKLAACNTKAHAAR